MKSQTRDRSPQPSETDAPVPRVPFPDAFRFWLKLGFISFGGPAGQIAIMHRELVDRKKWISESRFLHALNYCMLLPGPEAQQLATYVGWLLHGVRGGLVAGGLFVIPSALILFGLSYLYVAHAGSPAIFGVLQGFRAVAAAIVAEAVLRIGRRTIDHRGKLLIAVAAFVAIHFLHVSFPWIVLGAGTVGWSVSIVRSTRGRRKGRADRPDDASAQEGAPPAAAVPPGHLLRVVMVGGGLWVGGLVILAGFRGMATLHVEEYLFFTKAALVTFGGAYAVLAYLAQSVAGQGGWLSHQQIVDGLALAETTPGPLIMVVQFVGFVAAWNHPADLSPLASALIGAAVASFVTFLPSFLFIFLGAPYIERLRNHRALSAALSCVTAAVVGVVLNLALVLGNAVLLPDGGPDWFAVGGAAAAFVALWRFRIDILWIVLGGGALGLFKVLFGG